MIQAIGKTGEGIFSERLKKCLVRLCGLLKLFRVLALEYSMESAGAEGKKELELLSTAGILDEEQNLEKIRK